MTKFYTLLLLSCISLTSCTKLLDRESQPASHTQQLRQVLTAHGYPAYNRAFQQGLVFMDDDVQNFFQPGRQPEIPEPAQAALPAFSWHPKFFESISGTNLFAGTKENFNAWARYYEQIGVVNAVLHQVDHSSGNLQERNMLKGESLALRAYYYFMLVNLYALPYQYASETSPGVPLILEPVYEGENKPRNTVKEVYGQIMTDLSDAISLLDNQFTGKDVYRINAASAHFLAARVSLYMGDWKKTIEHSDAVLARKSRLMQLTDWGTPDPDQKSITGPANIETIWAFGSLHDYRPDGYTDNFCPSSDLEKLYSEGDLRKGIYLLPVPQEEALLRGYRYIDGKRPMQSNSTQTGKNFRVAEVYLNRAEAYIQLYRETGNPEHARAALADLNTIRKSRFAAISYHDLELQDPDLLLTTCRTERRRELFGEDHRWFDLRRYGMPRMGHRLYTRSTSSGYIYFLQEKDLQYVWAIPESAIRLNPLLEQNPMITERFYIELRSF